MRFFGALLRSVGLAVAFGHNAVAAPMAGQAEPETRSSPPERAALFRQLGQDPALRARFAREPRSVLAEMGFDPALFRIPEHLDDALLARFLGDWSSLSGPVVGTGLQQVAADERPGNDQSKKDKSSGQPSKTTPPPDTRDNKRNSEPPAPVYGPPPGLRDRQ